MSAPSLFCFVGLHRYRHTGTKFVRGLDPFFARTFGDTLIVSTCESCGKVKEHPMYAGIERHD